MNALKRNWRIYLIEAWALGMFMVSAVFFTILIEHPAMPVKGIVTSALQRRMLMGLAMGLTAVLLIYSPWGKKSGAHMNPAVTLTFLALKRILAIDALYYICFQFMGGLAGVLMMKWLFPLMIKHATVNYAITVPGLTGMVTAFWAEAGISFLLMTCILFAGNSVYKEYTGYIAGCLLFLFISFEAPFSGMGINPARSMASAIPANNYTAIWVYFLAPIAAMLFAGLLYKLFFILKNGSSGKMMLHLNGNCEASNTYKAGKIPN